MAAFQPGQSGNPAGRPVGSKNRATLAVKDAFEAVFHDLQTGDQSLLCWAQANPTDFYKLASKLIPSEINASVTGNLTATIAGLGKSGSGKNDPAVEG